MKTLLIGFAAAATMFVGSPDRQRTIEEHYPTTLAQRIELRGFTGSKIKFRSWDKNEVSIKLEISVSTSNQRDEQKFLDGVALKQTQTSESLRIEFREPEFSGRSDRTFWSWLRSAFSGSFISKEIDGEIFVPRSNPLTAEVRYGTIDMDGVKGPLELLGTGNTVKLRNCSSIGDVNNDYGKVTIENSGGNLQLSSKSTTIVLDQFSGKAAIDADYSNITARDVSQSLTIHSTSGTIKADNIGGNLSIRSDYSSITVNGVAGFLEVTDKSGNIRAKTMDGVAIDGDYSSMEISDVSGKGGKENSLRGQSGSISLENAAGNLTIDNPYGTVNLRRIRGSVDVKTKSSRVMATGVTGDWTSVTEYSTLDLRELDAKRVSIANSSGNVDVSLTSVPSSVDIKNQHAGVDLELPQGFSGDVDLNVSYGKITTNLPLAKKKSFDDGGGGYAMGKMGSGNGNLSIETRSGNIRVTER